MTRLDRKLIALAHQRARMIERIKRAEEQHKSTKGLQARLVDATRQQIKTELSIERRRSAA